MPEATGETAFVGPRFSVRVDRFDTAGGVHVRRDVVVLANSVGVLAYTNEGKILMVTQYRHAVGKDLLEIPAGVIDPGESALGCALRELAEETGYAAQHLEELASIYLSPGVLSEKLTFFRARELVATERHPDPGEELVVAAYDPNDLVEMARSGLIEDAKTLVALSYI